LDTFLNHRYRLDAEIGRGAMGTVYCSHDVLLDRDVAVKVLQTAELGEADRERLLHEARAAAQLNHPNVVAIYDAGQAGGVPFIVMEMVDGHTLYDRRPEGMDEIVACALQICAGLEHAHSRGIVHRDLKPENVILLADGQAKIMDFGLARSAHLQLNTEGEFAGTPFYLAPEQALGQEVDARTDLYALGVMLYEWTTGRLPFEGEDLLAILAQHLHADVIPARTRNPGIPPALDALIVQLLSKKPKDRPASAGEVRQRLAQVLEGRTPAQGAETAAKLPSFLAREAPHEAQRPVVVARDQELDRLGGFLERAMQGDGQMVFLTGEAGTGKTLLATEFARRAEAKQPDLLVTVGNCNALTGVGDAYLPFREVLSVLTGDLEGKWAGGLISSEAAHRLWAALPLTFQALFKQGQNLVDLLVPGPGLISRLEAAGLARPEWIAQVQARVAQRTSRTAELEQALIFQQYTRVLLALASQKPLLLLLDDLQWADTASIGLLYHLGRRLQGSRVLIVAAYRPDQVAVGRDGGPHPLDRVLAELKRYGGDTWVELGWGQESEGRTFVDALLDTKPNRLGPAFRDALYRLTGGHPLFTVELLRAMEERGELKQDREGTYVAAVRLNWSSLPARVEGVIEERIGRLDEDLAETLSVASVEGETFTAQVVARVKGRDEREVMRQLSQELEKTHRLIGPQGIYRVRGQRLQRYRFRDNLFQWHLYNRLAATERELLHEDVAVALEELYGAAASQIAPQLAYHYRRAGNADQARTYLEMAGDQARARYAVEEAIGYYTEALALTPEADLDARYRLLLAREEGYDLQGDREAEVGDLAALAALAGQAGQPQKQAEVALRRAAYAARIGRYVESIEAAQEAVAWAGQAGDGEQEAEGYRLWGRGLVGLGRYDEARSRLDQAFERAQAMELKTLIAHTLRSLGEVAFYTGEYARARQDEEQALAIYRQTGNRRAEGMSLGTLGMVAGSLEDGAGAWSYYQMALAAFREVGDRGGEVATLSNLGYTLAREGNYRQAQDYYQQALAGLQEVGSRPGEAITLCNLGLGALAQDDGTGAQDRYGQALAIAREIGERWIEGYALTGLGQALALLGRLDEAVTTCRQAVALRADLGQTDLLMESRAALARVALARGDLSEARACVDDILGYLDGGHELGGTETPFLILQTCIGVLRAVQDPRTTGLLQRSYALLQERAARISDEAARQVFLQAVRWHRDIVQEWEARNGGYGE
jgi:adenylate cyclase